MTTLHSCPCLALALLLLLCVVGCIANGSRINKEFGSLQSHKSCCLWIPLVPANKHSKLAYACLDWMETKVAGCEIELLVVSRIVGDVHLAVFAGYRSVALYHYSRVVVETWSTTLEERSNNDNIATLSHLTKELG